MTHIQTLIPDRWENLLKLANVTKDNIEDVKITFFADGSVGPMVIDATAESNPLLVFKSWDDWKDFMEIWDDLKDKICRS